MNRALVSFELVGAREVNDVLLHEHFSRRALRSIPRLLRHELFLLSLDLVPGSVVLDLH